MSEQQWDWEWPEDDRCTYCGIDLTDAGSHYHCPRCRERCSMMGHRTDEQCENARQRRFREAS